MNDPLSLLEPVLADPEVVEILIDGHQHVTVEKRGVLVDLDSPFTSEEQLLSLIDDVLRMAGQTFDEMHPLMDLHLEDGTRVNIVLPPVSRSGPLVTMRKAIRKTLTIEDVIAFGSLNQAIADFLKICVQARLNILVAGGTASGKTTLLNILARWLPTDERVVIVQHDIDFLLAHPRAITLETRPANREGRGQVTITDLIRNAFHMRPDRIIVPDVSGGEAYELLNGINMGHDGSMFAIHANHVRDALGRLEGMVHLSAPSLTPGMIREQIASAIHLITYQERMSDGRRRLTRVSEISGIENGNIHTRDLFEFRTTGIEAGRITGVFTATGIIPAFYNKLRQAGFDLPINLFTPV